MRAPRELNLFGPQELNDLLQLGLFLIGTGHIGKGCLALVLLLIFDLGAATFMMPRPRRRGTST